MVHRLLHLADLHLDRSFAGTGAHGELARRRRQGLREALRRAGQAAIDHGCTTVTVGGDLYEHERSGPDTAQFLVDTFAAWAPMRVFIAPGNHDALLPGSLYARTTWPSNVHVFTEPELHPVELASGLTLWGLAHREPSWQGDPLEGDRIDDRSGVHIALFHGSEMGSRPAGKSVHGPFAAERIRARGFSAALCGHYHRRRIDASRGLLYPGTPEPLGFDDQGSRGPVVVEVGADGALSYTPLGLNRWVAQSVGCDLTGVASVTGAHDAACATAAVAMAGVDTERAMLRIDLTGELRGGVAVDVFILESILRDTIGAPLVKVRDLTSITLGLDAAMTDPSARGVFARAVQTALAETDDTEERAILEDALRYGLQALAGVEVGLR